MSLKATVLVTAGCILLAGTAMAQSGPVANACKADIAKYCKGLGHGNRETRTCLEKNKDKVSKACKTALDTTGKGRGRNRQQ